jgi:serine protease
MNPPEVPEASMIIFWIIILNWRIDMRLNILLFFLLLGFSFSNPDGRIVVGNSLSSYDGMEHDGYIVDFEDGYTESDLNTLEKSLGIDVRWVKGYETQKIGWFGKGKAGLSKIVEKLKKFVGIEYIEPNYILSLYGTSDKAKFNDPYFKYQWHMNQMKMPEVYDKVQGEGAVVAVIDTGVAFEKFQGYTKARDLVGTKFYAPYNFINNTPHANDDHGHGTHVAGTIAQTTNNKMGVVGIAPQSRIMPLKVLDASGRGDLRGIAAAIRYAADNGAKIVNMSLGGPFPSRTLRKACKYAVSQGVLLICAAGNSGKSVGYPAAYPECMAVSATQFDEKITFYSSRGKQIEIAAPGGNTQLDQNNDGYPDGVLQNTIYQDNPAKDDYMLFMGTSMACPHVAGVAALLYSAGVTEASRIRSILKSSARPKGQPTLYGSGLLDAEKAIHEATTGVAWWRLLVLLALCGLFGSKIGIKSIFLHP